MNVKRIKALTRDGLRLACSKFGGDRTGRKVILCFHSIRPHAPHSSIHPDDFDRMLGWLSQHTDVMGVNELLDCHRHGNPRPAVAITFDDGHKDNAALAMPIAMRHGLKFTVFFTVGVVERNPRAFNRFKSVLRQATADFEVLTWDDAESLLENGFSVGSHTWDHPMLSHLPDEGIEFQLRISKEFIEKRLGLKEIGMCYPYGKFGRNVDRRVARLTEKAGYTYGLAVEHRKIANDENRFLVPRFIVNSSTVEHLRLQVEGGEDFHGLISRAMPASLARLLSPTDFHEAEDAEEPLIRLTPDITP